MQADPLRVCSPHGALHDPECSRLAHIGVDREAGLVENLIECGPEGSVLHVNLQPHWLFESLSETTTEIYQMVAGLPFDFLQQLIYGQRALERQAGRLCRLLSFRLLQLTTDTRQTLLGLGWQSVSSVGGS